jgi:hypothetical protein
VKLFMEAAKTYNIVFHTDGDSYEMLDPEIDIQTAPPPPPGLACNLPAQVGDAIHSVGAMGEDCWTWPSDSMDDQNDHDFTCDSATGGDVVIEYTTGAAQTTLNYDAAITSTDSMGYIGLEITSADCATGGSLYCEAASGTTTDTGNIAVTANTTYYVWISDAFSGNYLPAINICLW